MLHVTLSQKFYILIYQRFTNQYSIKNVTVTSDAISFLHLDFLYFYYNYIII